MKFLCKLFGHKMYSINWTPDSFTVICIRCSMRWDAKNQLGIYHE